MPEDIGFIKPSKGKAPKKKAGKDQESFKEHALTAIEQLFKRVGKLKPFDGRSSIQRNELIQLLGEAWSNSAIIERLAEDGRAITSANISYYRRKQAPEIAVRREAFLRSLPEIANAKWRMVQFQRLFDDLTEQIWLDKPTVSNGVIVFFEKRSNHILAAKILDLAHKQQMDILGLMQPDDEPVHRMTPEQQMNWLMTDGDPNDNTWRKNFPEDRYKELIGRTEIKMVEAPDSKVTTKKTTEKKFKPVVPGKKRK